MLRVLDMLSIMHCQTLIIVTGDKGFFIATFSIWSVNCNFASSYEGLESIIGIEIYRYDDPLKAVV